MSHATTPPRVLCVDDEPLVLEVLRRTLEPEFEVDVATSGAEALTFIDADPPIAVVISDMRMPLMDGAQVLQEVRAQSPDTTRMLLTGYADLTAAMNAVNQGGIFRFLLKPAAPEELLAAVRDGVAQHQLVRGQRELLEETLVKSVRLMNDVTELVSPSAASRASFLRSYIRHVVARTGLADAWVFETAATLSQLATITIAGDVRDRHAAGQPLTPAEAQDIASAHDVMARLVEDIPRLGDVARVVRYLGMPVGTAAARSAAAGEGPIVQVGVELLQAVLLFDRALTAGTPVQAAADQASGRGVRRPLSAALASYPVRSQAAVVRAVRVAELVSGMVFEEEVRSRAGAMLVSAGKEVDLAIVAHLKRCMEGVGVREPLKVRLTVADGARR